MSHTNLAAAAHADIRN